MHTLDCSTEFELLQAKAEIAEKGYRYVAIGLVLRYWEA